MATDVGQEVRRAEALAHRQRAAHPEGRHEADEHRVRVEERHAGVADVVLTEAQVRGDRHPDREQLQVVVQDALGQSGRAGGVDHHERRLGGHLHLGRGQLATVGAGLAGHGLAEVGAGERAVAGADVEDVLGCHVLQLAADLLDVLLEALVDDQEPRPRLVQDARKHLAAQARIHPEEREPRVAAATVEEHELGMVLEDHRDMPRTRLVDLAESTEQEVRGAHALVAVLLVGPDAVVLQQDPAAGNLGVFGAGLDLGTEQEGGGDRRSGHVLDSSRGLGLDRERAQTSRKARPDATPGHTIARPGATRRVGPGGAGPIAAPRGGTFR